MDPDFNATDAELILRSCDNIDFAVHRTILWLASPVFRDMLSLPQNADTEVQSSRPVIEMVEDAPSLRILLKFCYPRSSCNGPELHSILDVKRAATLAKKYDIALLHKKAERALLRCNDDSPAVVFAVAWRFGYQDALRASARRSLDVPYFFTLHVPDIADALELAEVQATSLAHLLRYHITVAAQLEPICISSRERPLTWITPEEIWAQPLYGPTSTDPECTCALTTVWFPQVDLTRPVEYRVYSWWSDYVHSVVASMQRDSRPDDLEMALNEPLLDCMKAALLCTTCNGGALASRVLYITRTALRRTIEDRLDEIPLPVATVLD